MSNEGVHVSPRHHPAFIRQVLVDVATYGPSETKRRHDVSFCAMAKWRKRQLEDPSWLDVEKDAEWERIEAARVKHRAYRNRLTRGVVHTVDATGTRRRLQALAALGWTFQRLGDELGKGRSGVSAIVNSNNRTSDTCYRSTAEQVATVYDRLSMTPPPDNWVTRKQRAYALGRGWVPPLAWDEGTIDDPKAKPDRAAVAPLVSRSRSRFTREESITLDRKITRLRADGRSAREIALRVGYSQSAIEKRFARMRGKEAA